MVTASGVVTEAQVVSTEGTKPTYRAEMPNAVPAATATDLATICGATGKVIRITHTHISMNAGSQSSIDLYLYKRTAADTGGTSSTITAVKLDTLDATPSVTVKLYTANPTAVGTGVLMLSDHYDLQGTNGAAEPWEETYGTRNSKAVVLRGATECLAFGFNGQAIPASSSVHVGFEWTEE